MRYKLNKRLISIGPDETLADGECLIEIMKKEDYCKRYGTLVHNHLLMRNLERAQYCRVELLNKCDIGTFVIPNKGNLMGPPLVFGYYMDRKSLIFVDDTGEVSKMLHEIEKVQILEKTYVAHLFFELLEYLIRDEVQFLQEYEEKLSGMEDLIMSGQFGDVNVPGEILKMRKELSRVQSFYNQLMNMSDSLTENYNSLLREEDCALFHLFSDRITRLTDHARDLREYSLQIREMYQAGLNERQNHVLSFLTMVTTIFMPLTLIAGWYGMNFANMPELEWKYAYFVCAVLSMALIVVEIWYFRKKGWLKK